MQLFCHALTSAGRKQTESVVREGELDVINSMACVAGSWGIACALLALNAAICLVAATLAGWTFNKEMDYAWGDFAFGENMQGRVVASYFLPLALVASVVGMGSILAGLYHLRVWRTDSLAAAVSVALVAWLLGILAAGIALKELHVGGRRPTNLRVVEGFIIVLPLFEFYYLLSLHAAVLLRAQNRGNSRRDSPKEELPEKIDCIVVEDGRERAVRLALET